MQKILIPILLLGGIIGVITYLEAQKVSPSVAQNLNQEKPTQEISDNGVVDLKTDNLLPTETKPNQIDKTPEVKPDNKIVSEEIKAKLKKYKKYIELVRPDGYLNTDKITIGELVGKKVILVDFWTYSCINCQRTLPYLNAWYEKYKDDGLEIIGVHTPEFGFEKIKDNVASAIAKYNIKYPVVQDNNYQTWSAYQNQYWPRKYLVDIDGFIVYDHIGEGGYMDTEDKIRELLEEKKNRLGAKTGLSEATVSDKIKSQADFSKIASPETYFGSARNNNLGNGIIGKAGTQTLFEPSQSSIVKNLLYLSGDWNFTSEYAENSISGGKIIFKYNSKSVYLVTGSTDGVEVDVYRDGSLLTGAGAGSDLKNGGTMIKENRLYKLIEDAEYGEHILEIRIKSGKLQAFAFTFG